MDFVPLIDRFGEASVGAGLGIVLGTVFGALAYTSGFCTRSAVIDLFKARGRQESLGLWLVAIGVAVLGTQLLIAADLIAVSESRFLSAPPSFAGVLTGGALFGVGMALARGCASRLLLLSASGNLRALLSVAILGATAAMTMDGPLTSLRTSLSSLWPGSIAPAAMLDPAIAIWIASGLIVGGLMLARQSARGVATVFSSLAIGALFPLGWYLVHSLSAQVFEPIPVESFAFLRPIADMVGLAVPAATPASLGVDHGMVLGTLAGAFVAALWMGRFSIRTFRSTGAARFWRYPVGGSLMGFGGILAGGCTIGAGFTGGSVMAAMSLLALASIIAGCAVTHLLLDGNRNSKVFDTALVPAE